MFLVWNAVILGTNSSLIDSNGAIQAISDPLMRLRSASGIVGVSSSCTLQIFTDEEVMSNPFMSDSHKIYGPTQKAAEQSLKLDETCEKKSSTRGQHIWMESKDLMMGGCWVVTVCAQSEKKMIGEGTENCVWKWMMNCSQQLKCFRYSQLQPLTLVLHWGCLTFFVTVSSQTFSTHKIPI